MIFLQVAIVTGASSGIGLAVSKKLIANNYKVYGIARDFAKVDFQHPNFVNVDCDLQDITELQKKTSEIIKSEKNITVLVNNAGIGYFGWLEELKVSDIAEMVSTNLLAPFILTKLLLRHLKKTGGFVINISSVTATKPSPIGTVYAATKAGLSHFGASLFEEVRKYGVKVVTIEPDITKSNFYNHLFFQQGEDDHSYLLPETIAETVEFILDQPAGTIINHLTIRPAKHQIRRKNLAKNKQEIL